MKNAIKWKLITYGLLPILLLAFILFLIFQEPAPDYIDPSIVMTSTTSNKEIIYASIKSIEEKKSDGPTSGTGVDYSGGFDQLFWLSAMFESNANPAQTSSSDIGLFCFDHLFCSAKVTTYIYNADPSMFSMLQPYSAYADGRNNPLKNNQAFYAAWEKAYAEHPVEFTKLQCDYAVKEFYTPKAACFMRDTGIDPATRSKAVQASILGVGVWKPAIWLNGWIKEEGLNSNSTDAEIIEAINDTAIRYMYANHAGNSNIPGWINRWGDNGRERLAARAMLDGTFDYTQNENLMTIINILEGK